MATKKKAPEVKIGRPSSYTKKLGDMICLRIIEGESLRRICQDPGYPDKATVFRWLSARQSFRDQYAHAREAQADTFVDEIQDIADEKCKDMVAVQRNKMRIDSRKWLATKLRPKVYGSQPEMLDPDQDAPPPVRIVVDVKDARRAEPES